MSEEIKPELPAAKDNGKNPVRLVKINVDQQGIDHISKTMRKFRQMCIRQGEAARFYECPLIQFTLYGIDYRMHLVFDSKADKKILTVEESNNKE